MSKNKVGKKWAAFTIIPLIIVLAFIFYKPITDNIINLRNINYLSKYGWNVVSGGKTSNQPILLSKDLLSDELTKMKLNASGEIGLTPENYIDKPLSIYNYQLAEKGKNNNLMAELWLFDSTIVCASIYHSERNVKLEYWPLNKQYIDIINNLELLIKLTN